MRLQRGAGLAGVLVIVTLCFTLCSVLASTAMVHFRVARQSEHQLRAQGMAELALAQAVDQLNRNPNFGAPGQAGFGTWLTPRANWSEGATGRLGFGNALLYSTNNLMGTAAVEGWGGAVVPPRCVHLVAEGRSGPTRRILEVHYQNNPFPYAIGSNVPLVSEGSLLVGSLPEGKMRTLQEPPPEDELKPGHLKSNARQVRAVELSPETLVTGNVESAGGIELAPAARVLGATRAYAGATRFPEIDLQRFNPGTSCPELQSHLSSPRLEGKFRVQGELRVEGDLTLQEGMIFIDGDCHIEGGLRGKGAIVCTGKLTVGRASRFSNDQQVALLSQGDLELRGQGADRSYIQGLVYSKGSVKTSDITLMGSLIQTGQGQGQVDISNSHLVHVPEYSKLRLDFRPPPTPPQLPPVYLDNSINRNLLRTHNGVSDFLGIWAPQDQQNYYDAANDRFRVPPGLREQFHISFGTQVHGPGGSWNQQVHLLSAGRALAADPRWATLIAQTGTNLDSLVDQVYQQLVTTVDQFNEQYQAFRAYHPPSQRGLVDGSSFVLDLNEFLSPGDRLRLVRWQHH